MTSGCCTKMTSGSWSNLLGRRGQAMMSALNRTRWSKNEIKAIKLLACLLCAMLLLAAGVVAQEPPPNAKWRLTTIVFEGLKSQPPDKMIDACGLKVGQTIDFEMVKAAAQRLSQTGLFKKVAYRYRYSSTHVQLTFDLESTTKR